jgi:hypothetical protein
MNFPIVAHIKQNTLACNHWLLIAKTHPLWTGLPKELIRLIYWTIFEKHPAQIWHDRIFKEITSISTGCIWYICIPKGYGSTYMARRLRTYYENINKTNVRIADKLLKCYYENRMNPNETLIICAPEFYITQLPLETNIRGIPVEYRD